MFECLLCKARGVKWERENLVPHIKRNHPEINGDTKIYKKMFPNAKMRKAPKTNFANKEHSAKAIEKSIKSRTGKHLSEEHKNKIGNSNKNSEKYKEAVRIRSEKYKSGEKIHHNTLTEEKISISKKDLLNLYCEEKLSLNEIGRRYDLNNKTIKKYLNFYGVETRDRYTSQMLTFLNGEEFRKLSEIEKEILEGEILGDGCLDADEGQTPTYRHSCKYSDFLLWLMSLFKSFRWSDSGINSKYDKKAKRAYFGVNSKVHPEFIDFYNKFYYYNDVKKKQCKKIPKDFILTPIKLLHWFLGDGCLYRESKKKHIWHLFMATYGFDIKDLEEIIKPQLTLMGINCKIKKEKSGPTIQIYNESFERFYDVIGPKSPVQCYNYKFKIVEENFQNLLNKDLPKNTSLSKKDFLENCFNFYRKNGM